MKLTCRFDRVNFYKIVSVVLLFSPNNIPIQHKIEFNSSYDKVWQAVLKALEQYPILKADKDLGIITTGYVNTVSCQNMFYKGRKKAKKFGYFVYKLFGNENFAIVVATEKGSPAYGKLFPKDIIINYDLVSIKQENYFKFKIYRNEKIYNILLKKKKFFTLFAEPLALNGRMKFNIRLKRINDTKTFLTAYIHEDQLEAFFHSDDRILSIGTFEPIRNDGYKELLFRFVVQKNLDSQL